MISFPYHEALYPSIAKNFSHDALAMDFASLYVLPVKLLRMCNEMDFFDQLSRSRNKSAYICFYNSIFKLLMATAQVNAAPNIFSVTPPVFIFATRNRFTEIGINSGIPPEKASNSK